MINKVILIGNLGRDPEVRILENGTKVAKFSIATNESYLDKSNEWQTLTEWHDIVLWRNLAERAERQLKKGNQIFVEGKLTHRKYQDKDGVDRYITEVVASTFRLLDRKEGGNSGTFPTAANEPMPMSQSSRSNDSSQTSEDMEEDDLPF